MLGNFQGQPLTPIQRGLDRAQSGFAVLLNSIQGVANRVVENKKIAEQRDWTERRDKELYERQLTQIQFTQDLQQKNQMEVLKARTVAEQNLALLENQLELTQKEEERKYALSQQGLETRRLQNYYDSLGTSQGRAGERQEQTRQNLVTARNNKSDSLFKAVQEYPTLGAMGIEPYVDAFGNTGYQMLNPETNEYQVLSDGQMNYIISQEARKKDQIESIQSTYLTDEFDVYTQNQARDIINRYNQGLYTSFEAMAQDINNIEEIRIDPAITREANTNARLATTGLYTILSPSNLSSDTAPEWLKPFASAEVKPLFTADRVDNDQGLLQAYSTQGSRGEKIAAIAQYVDQNFASLQDLSGVLRANSEYLTEYPEATQFQNNLQSIIQTGASTGMAGASIYPDPFAPAQSRKVVSTSYGLATSIYNKLSNRGSIGTAVPTNTTRQYIPN